MLKLARLHEYLKVSKSDLEKLGVHDGFIGIDSRLFIDPFLFENTSDIPEFHGARAKIKEYFRKVVVLLKASRQIGDRPWLEAVKRLTLKEISALSIGYGKGTNQGSGIGPELAEKLAKTAKEIISFGIENPELFELMGLFEEDYGPDRLSDMSAGILEAELLAYTQRCSADLRLDNLRPIKTKHGVYSLPTFSDGKSILFVPSLVLRDLPIAQSFEDIGRVKAINDELRSRYSRLIAEVMAGEAKKPSKTFIRRIILADASNIKTLIETYSDSKPIPYDFAKDPSGEEHWYEAAVETAKKFPLELSTPKNPQELSLIVDKIVKHFKRVIELNGTGVLLFDDNGDPRHERYAQQYFFGLALAFCEIYDISVEREPNSGRGPVDFKFPSGFSDNIIVELKLSSNTRLNSGSIKQLRAYTEADRAKRSILLLILVTNSDIKIKNLEKVVEQDRNAGNSVPEVVIIDARPKPSASKLK